MRGLVADVSRHVRSAVPGFSSRQPPVRLSAPRPPVQHGEAAGAAPSRTACGASTSGRGFADAPSKKKGGSQKGGSTQQSTPSDNMMCPCGSKKQYKACCSAIHRGAWPRNLVEFVGARVSGTLLGLTEFLADTIHPEGLDAISGRNRMLTAARAKCRQYQTYRFRLVDLCVASAQEVETEGDRTADGHAWVAMLALEGTNSEGEKGHHIEAYRFTNQGGRWMLLEELSLTKDLINSTPFARFVDKYFPDPDSQSESDDDSDASALRDAWRAKVGVQDDGSEWPFQFELVSPSYAPAGTATEDELLGPWLWDELAVEDGQPPAAGLRPACRRRKGLVYLDDYAPSAMAEGAAVMTDEQRQLLFDVTGEDGADGEGLSVRRSTLLDKKLREKLRNPDMDVSTWMYRSGRFS